MEMNTKYKGIDISKWQGDIDFNKVKNSGIDFVIIRAGYRRFFGKKDNCFEKNYEGAKAAGLDVGAYWYSYANSILGAYLDAKACLKIIKGKQFEYPIYFDLEEPKQFKKGKGFCTRLVNMFCMMLEKKGCFAGLYISRSFLQTHIAEKTARRYALWIAEHGSKCNYNGVYGMWQYSSDGRVNGIFGDVDMDLCYSDYPSIIKNGGFNGF